MKVLLLGGTGAMGVHLAKLLNEDKTETHVTSRKRRSDYGTVRFVEGDAHSDEFLLPLLRANKYDVVVDFMVYGTEEFKVRAPKMLESCARYVFLSSSRVYADSPAPITEESPRLLDVSDDRKFLATDEYALTKARQEDILRSSGFANWTIIRPYITYSEIRLQLGVLEKELWLNRALCGKTVVFSEDIFRHKTTLTYGEDVARGIKAIIGNDGAKGEVFHITQEKALTWEDIWNVYKKVLTEKLGKEPKIKLVDMATFRKMYPGVYQIDYDRLYDRVFDNSKIAKFVDAKAFLTPEEGLEKSLRQFIDDGAHFNCASWSTAGIADRITGERTPLKEINGLANRIRYATRRAGITVHKPGFLNRHD